MADFNFVRDTNLGTFFDLSNGTSVEPRLGTGITQDVAGAIQVDISALDIVSADAGNLIQSGTDDGALFTQVDLQAAETVWNGTVGAGAGFLGVTAGGTNGHAPTFTLNYSDADFVEGVQDAVGSAILAGAGITYDDVADSISSALGTLTFGDGLTSSGLTSVAVLPDPASPLAVSVSAAGVSVADAVSADAGNLASLGTDNLTNVAPGAVRSLATQEICDVFGNSLGIHAFPTNS